MGRVDPGRAIELLRGFGERAAAMRGERGAQGGRETGRVGVHACQPRTAAASSSSACAQPPAGACL